MILVEMHEKDSDEERMGFNCGKSDSALAQLIADSLRAGLHGDMKVYGPEMIDGNDFIVTVMCAPGTLTGVTALVGVHVAIMRRRGQLG